MLEAIPLAVCFFHVRVMFYFFPFQSQSYDQNALDSSALPVEHRGGDSYGPPLAGPQLGGPQIGGVPGVPNDPWPLTQPDMPTIKNLQVRFR